MPQQPPSRRLVPRRVRIAAAGYATVAIFAIGAGVARMAGATPGIALAAGGLAAAPLVVAFVGDRISGISAFSVQISLREVTVPIEGDFSDAVMSNTEMMYQSAVPDLLASIRPLMQDHSKLLAINLGDGNYWWSTRIFLVAALAHDFTEVEALIFVQSGDGQTYVGIASPRATRTQLATAFPQYEIAYRKTLSEASDFDASHDQEVDEILQNRWPTAMPSEGEIKRIVSSDDLRHWLGRDLDTESLPYGPLTPSLRYRITSRARQYTALTSQRRLMAVVDGNELAIRSANLELETRFNRGS
jgi:hypothetical protein